MSLELVNTFATLGTFVVIAATASAAIIQLRHMRSSNHIAALNELRETTETPEFKTADQFIRSELAAKLQDPALRYQLAAPARAGRSAEIRSLQANIEAVGNFYENVGVLVLTGLIHRELVLQMYSNQVSDAWENLAPVLAIHRRRLGKAIWENFEYLTVLAQDWIVAHPRGTYPAGARRIDIKDQWLEADKQYVDSLGSA